METYYHVYDDAIIEIAEEFGIYKVPFRRAFIRLDPEIGVGFDYGDSLQVHFEKVGNDLVPVGATESGDSSKLNDGLSLAGVCLGHDSSGTSVLVGFKLPVSESEMDETAFVRGERKELLVQFTEQDAKLVFERLRVISTSKGRPKLLK